MILVLLKKARATATLLLLAAAVMAPPLGAQGAAPELTAPLAETGVTFTAAGYAQPSIQGGAGIPAALLERLASEPALFALDTAPVDGRVVLQVRFAFPDLAAFQRWRADPRASRLMADLREIMLGGSYETFISYRSPPRP